MPIKETMRICVNPDCGAQFKTIDYRKKFCSRSCSAKTNNANRAPMSSEQKEKIKYSLVKFYQEHPERKITREASVKNGIKSAKGKFKEITPKSILDVSRRTTRKIIQRLDLGCSNCGWCEGSCDIHHIDGKKIVDPHNHNNLTLLCPNCHRLAHEGKLKKESIVSLVEYIPEDWYKYYYG